MPVSGGKERRVSALLTGVSISPREVPLKGGERIVVTFPEQEKVPEASIYVVFTGDGVPNILRTEKINDHTVAAIAPGYSSEGQVKLEVLYSVQDTTVVLHRDWITYSKDAPRSLPQQSDMGASHSAAGETASPQDSPQDDHTLRRGDTLVTELLKECVQTEWVGSPSCAMVEALSASLQPLSSDNLARVDCEVAISLERGSLPRRVDTDHRREESPPTETTLLHVLAEYGMVCVVQYLVQLPGASQAAIRLDQSGRMPEEVAKEKGHRQLSQLLVQCRQELPCRDREARASSTSSIEEWSTTTIRAKRHSDRTLVRLASRSQGQLVKVSLEHDTFASMKAELGKEDPSVLTNGQVCSDSLERKNPLTSSVTSSTPSEDAPVPPCDESVVGSDSTGAAQSVETGHQEASDRISIGDNPVISVLIPSDEGEVTNSDNGEVTNSDNNLDNSYSESTATVPAITQPASEPLSDREGADTPTPESSPLDGHHVRASSIPSPELMPLEDVSQPGVNRMREWSSGKEKWRRSKSWSAVDQDDQGQLWNEEGDEEEEEKEDQTATPELALDLIDGPMSVTSGSDESSLEGDNEEDAGNQLGSDTDEFISAKEEFANSPALHRAKSAGQGSEGRQGAVVDRPDEGGETQQDSRTSNAAPLPAVGNSEPCDDPLGGVPADERSESSSDSKPDNFLHPQTPQVAVSVESDMSQLSDLNLSDVDVSVGSVGEGGPDDSLSRDRGLSDPLPQSIAAARVKIEESVSKSHELLPATATQGTPTTCVPVIEEIQPGDEISTVAKQPNKRRSSRSKTDLGISSPLSHSCDSGFESNISRHPSTLSDSSPTRLMPVTGVRRSHSARVPSSVAERLRTTHSGADEPTTGFKQLIEEMRADGTLRNSNSTSSAASPTVYSHKRGHLDSLRAAGLDEDEEGPPKLYQTSIEQVVRERGLLQSSPEHTSPVRKGPSTPPAKPNSNEEGQQKKAALLLSPLKSRPQRSSEPGDMSLLHHVEGTDSSGVLSKPLEGRTSPDGARKSAVRSMLIQPSQSMTFNMPVKSSADSLSDSGSTHDPVSRDFRDEPPPLRRRSGPQVGRAARASIAIERPSQHQLAQHKHSTSHLYGLQSSSQSVSNVNEDQVSRVSSSTIMEEREQDSSAGEEEEEEGSEGSNLSSYPELAVQQPQVWSHTVSKKTLKKLNPAERDRQALMFELIQTERNHLRTLVLLDYGFKKNMREKAGLSEEQLQVMFPVLQDLVAISKEFTQDLMARQDEAEDGIIDSVSDIVARQFAGKRAEKMVRVYGEFAARQVYIVEQFKEHWKGKKFRRVINDCYKDPAVQRRKFPDLVQGVTSRISKYVLLMDNLVKESQRCKAEDLTEVEKAKELVARVVEDVEKAVKDKTSLMELESLQGKLEIHIPKSTVRDDKERRELKALKFTAPHRRLLRNGRAIWLGSHQKQLDVYLVLVTDFIVFLVDTNGKYNIAVLQDFQVPVIRLVDIHVRVDAASKVQLLLMTKSRPEIFKLKFKNQIECERWESAILSAVEICKKKGFSCKSFGDDSSPGEDSTSKPVVKTAEAAANRGLPSDPKERMLFEANQRLSATQRLLDKARLKDKSHVGVQRAGSLAAADRPARPFLVNSPRLGDSQKGGLAGARNRPERKTLGPKVKQNSSQTQEVPAEYFVCLSNMADTVQQLLKCVGQQDATIAQLRDQLAQAAARPVPKMSASSVESESNLDWGSRQSLAGVNSVVVEEVDSSLTQSVPTGGGIAMVRTSSNNLYAPTRHTVGTTSQRPRSFHEEGSFDPL